MWIRSVCCEDVPLNATNILANLLALFVIYNFQEDIDEAPEETRSEYTP